MGHGLQGGSVLDDVPSVKAGTRAPSCPNELIALVISSKVNRVNPGSKPKGLLGPTTVRASLRCNLSDFPSLCSSVF